MLYSHNRNYPTSSLPNRIRLSNGLTRTDKNSFTEEEIADAGYVPVKDKPTYNENLQKVKWNGDDWEVIQLTQSEINTLITQQWQVVRSERDILIKDEEWKINRYHSEVRLGLEPTDDITKLDEYIQALRDVTKQPDPFNISWPDLPTKVNDDAVDE